MSSQLTNLLPETRKRAFRRQYFLRLGTAVLVLLALLALLHGIMLLPTYFYARHEVLRGSADLATLKASARDAGEAEVATRTQNLAASAANLARLESVPAASAALRAALDVPRPGIALTGFTFTAPAAANAPARRQISGMAGSRDALRRYAAALESLPFVASADLPISAYAKERDIDFTITLSGTLQP